MHDLVAATDRAGLKKIGLPVGAGDESPGFANEKCARRNIPGIKTTLPEGVEPAGGDVSQIERGATHPTHINDAGHHSRELCSEPRMLRRLAEMGNAATEDRLRHVAAPRHTQPAIAAKRSLTLLRHVHVIVCWIVDDASDDLPFTLQRD